MRAVAQDHFDPAYEVFVVAQATSFMEIRTQGQIIQGLS